MVTSVVVGCKHLSDFFFSGTDQWIKIDLKCLKFSCNICKLVLQWHP